MKKKILTLLICGALTVSLAGCGSDSEDAEAPGSDNAAEEEAIEEAEEEADVDAEDAEENAEADEVEDETEETAAAEYDTLQELFLSASDSYTEEELLNTIEENGLYYNDEERTGNKHAYKVAYTDGVAELSFADEGDHLELTFDADSGLLLSADYHSDDPFVNAFWNDSKTDSEYSYTDFSTSPVLRENGSKSGAVETNYYEADSLEDALNSALTMK